MMQGIKAIVFDLDFTLWDCGGTWVDCTRGPYTRRGQKVYDGDGREMLLYQDVLSVLDECDRQGCPMALASRTDSPPQARKLLETFEISKRFKVQEIYPGDKQSHLRQISKKLGLSLESLLFFDDEMRNIHSTSSIGVKAVHVEKGLTWALFKQSLKGDLLDVT